MSRYKNILFLVAVLIVQVIGLAVQIRRPSPSGGDAPTVRLIRLWAIGLMSPPEKAVHGGGSGLRSMWSNYIDLRHVRQQNQELKERVSGMLARVELAAERPIDPPPMIRMVSPRCSVSIPENG